MRKLALLFAALLVPGCGEKKATGDNGGGGNDEGAGDGVVSESGEAPASPESRLIGYWRVDAESTFKEWEENPPSHDFDAASWKERFAEAEKLNTETLQFLADGKVTSHGLYGESGSYAIKTSDNDSKDLEVEMEIEFFGSGKLFFSPSRKTLTLQPDLQLPVERRGPPVVLIGIDETEAKERIEVPRTPADFRKLQGTPLNEREKQYVGRWAGGDHDHENQWTTIIREDHTYSLLNTGKEYDEDGEEVPGKETRTLLHGIWAIANDFIYFMHLVSSDSEFVDDESNSPSVLEIVSMEAGKVVCSMPGAVTEDGEPYKSVQRRIEKFEEPEMKPFNAPEALKGFDILKADKTPRSIAD